MTYFRYERVAYSHVRKWLSTLATNLSLQSISVWQNIQDKVRLSMNFLLSWLLQTESNLANAILAVEKMS